MQTIDFIYVLNDGYCLGFTTHLKANKHAELIARGSIWLSTLHKQFITK